MECAVGSRGFLDPRTKFLLLLTLPLFLMGGAGGEYLKVFRIVFAVLPFLLLLVSKNYVPALTGLFIYILLEAAAIAGLSSSSGGIACSIFMLMNELFCRLLPCGILAVFVMRTTPAGAFIAGMEKLKFPGAVTVPLAVMLRFFPVVLEEYRYVGKAMTMRGITIKRAGPAAFLEYRMVPVLMSIVRIGQELTAAALARGLRPGVKRTSIHRLEFKKADYAVMLWCSFAFLFWILSLCGIRFPECWPVFPGD